MENNNNNSNTFNYDNYFFVKINDYFKKRNKLIDFFTHLDEENIHYLRNNYKILDVDYLDPILVKSKMFNDDYFELLPKKKEIVNVMLDFYMNHKDNEIYKKTNYLCDAKEKICICNIHANDLRKIYDGINHDQNVKYISWLRY